MRPIITVPLGEITLTDAVMTNIVSPKSLAMDLGKRKCPTDRIRNRDRGWGWELWVMVAVSLLKPLMKSVGLTGIQLYMFPGIFTSHGQFRFSSS